MDEMESEFPVLFMLFPFINLIPVILQISRFFDTA
jgi:hypothetical protein